MNWWRVELDQGGRPLDVQKVKAKRTTYQRGVFYFQALTSDVASKRAQRAFRKRKEEPDEKGVHQVQ